MTLMRAYVVRRIARGIGLMIVALALTFVLFVVLPAGHTAALWAGRHASRAEIGKVKQQLGLGSPVYTQLFDYFKRIVFHFDFGYSYQLHRSVLGLVVSRLPATISLVAGAGVVSVLVGIPVGLLSAIRRRRVLDRGAVAAALVAVSAPAFWLGLIALYLFASDVGKLPILPGAGSYVGLTADPGKWFTSLLMPWLVLAAAFAAICARVVHGGLESAIDEDYIRALRARGVPERGVIFGHGARAALVPLVQAFPAALAALLGSAVLIEAVFSIPGVGLLSFRASAGSDFAIVQGTVLLATMLIIVVRVVAEIVHAHLDRQVLAGERTTAGA